MDKPTINPSCFHQFVQPSIIPRITLVDQVVSEKSANALIIDSIDLDVHYAIEIDEVHVDLYIVEKKKVIIDVEES